MSYIDTIKPRVFISYSWEDEEHIEWTKRLANCLIENGVDTHIDQYDLELGDRLPQFMEQEITNADYVLIICTPSYKEKANNRKSGVGYEGHIIAGELFQNQNEKKFIFPSKMSKDRHISHTAPTTLLHEIGYKKIQSVHGFRTMFASLCSSSRLWSYWAIEKQLSHKITGIHGFYNRVDQMGER
ncbi:TPA: TIR domain-containing protein [Pasteurella multocida]|nr:TIR domain-containing protein [Pasteurella multocida]AFF25337.1 hypothetical protein PMCN06_2112 [Pasteurella multocida subsp. multocida str. HN06]WEO86651.1 TIR domain-containing protein [Pasteurella multocida]HDR1324683.1 TIR domain-containing protein [Pasteurella multocida]